MSRLLSCLVAVTTLAICLQGCGAEADSRQQEDAAHARIVQGSVQPPRELVEYVEEMGLELDPPVWIVDVDESGRAVRVYFMLPAAKVVCTDLAKYVAVVAESKEAVYVTAASLPQGRVRAPSHCGDPEWSCASDECGSYVMMWVPLREPLGNRKLAAESGRLDPDSIAVQELSDVHVGERGFSPLGEPFAPPALNVSMGEFELRRPE